MFLIQEISISFHYELQYQELYVHLVVSKTNALFIQNILKWIKKSIYNRTSNEKQFKIWTLKLVFAKSRQCVENVKTTGCWGWNEQL